jgi:hypothetical protein
VLCSFHFITVSPIHFESKVVVTVCFITWGLIAGYIFYFITVRPTYNAVPRGGGLGDSNSPRNSEVLTKLSRISSSIENTSVTTWSEYGFHSFANWVEPLTRGYRPQILILSAPGPRVCLLKSPLLERIAGYATAYVHIIFSVPCKAFLRSKRSECLMIVRLRPSLWSAVI